MTNLSSYKQLYRTDDATATAGSILSGETAYIDGGKVTGTYVPTTPFNPGDISGLVFWLDAANPGVVANRWDDVSGNGRHFTSIDAAHYPTFSGGIATFDGTNDRLSGPNLSALGLTEGEIFIHQKRYVDDVGTIFAGWMQMGNDSSLEDHFTYAGTIYTDFGRTARVTVGNPSQPTDQWHVINIYSKVSLWRFFFNEEQMYSTTSNTVSFPTTTHFGGPNDTLLFRGDVKQIILYNRVLTSFERAQVRGYLAGL